MDPLGSLMYAIEVDGRLQLGVTMSSPEPDPYSPITELGVYDVKGGADETSLDGTAYSAW